MEVTSNKHGNILLTIAAEITEDLVEDDWVCHVRFEVRDMKNGIWQESGKSSTVRMSKFMAWNNEFEFEFEFQTRQPIKLTLFKYLEDENFIVGQALADLRDLVKNSKTDISLYDISGAKIGKFAASYSEDKGLHQKMIFQLAGENLADLDYFDKSDPYYRIYKQAIGDWMFVCESNIITDNLNPKWEPVSLKYSEFCSCNPESLIKIECFDYDTPTKSDYIGLCIFHAREFVTGASFQLRNPQKSNQLTGKILVKRSEIIEEASFLDYLSNGLKINMSLAIDFTASNGLPMHNNSLHHFSEVKESEYAQAIRLLGDVLSKYDSDNQIPVFGFGGIPTWMSTSVKHEFSLTKDETNPCVADFEQAISLYKSILPEIELKGPTLFAPIIRRQLSMFEEKSYTILIILTDGDIEDYDETVNLIVEASFKPLSIIIVGVGYENFLRMENLDSDQKLLRSKKGKDAVRDIVQFVRFRSFKQSLHYFTEKALEEVPLQLIKYMDMRR